MSLRSAAQRASASFAEQLGSSDDDEPVSRSSNGHTPKGRTRKAGGRRRSISTSGRQRTHSNPVAPSSTRNRMHARKRTREDETLSDLSTPPSSPGASAHNTLAEGTGLESDEAWVVPNLDDYVWVLLDLGGRICDPLNPSLSKLIWWPAKVTDKSVDTLKARSYGVFSDKPLDLKNPSHNNILPLTNPLGRVRFNLPSFVRLPSSGNTASPRKKRKIDDGQIKRHWRDALSQVVREKEHDDDGLPEVGFAFSVSTIHASVGQSTADVASVSSQEDDVMGIDPYPEPRGHDLLTIPGEVVFSRAKASSATDYWPAKIIDYIPSTSKGKNGKYRVEFLDTSTKDVPRAWFYASFDDEYATCKLGKYDSFIQDDTNDGQDSEDEGEEEAEERYSSPASLSRPPSPNSFCELTIHEQFSYTKKVLQAILDDAYEPARKIHKKFMAGGQARTTTNEEAGLRGKMDIRDLKKLHRYLSEWCFGDHQNANVAVNDRQSDTIEILSSDDEEDVAEKGLRESESTETKVASVLEDVGVVGDGDAFIEKMSPPDEDHLGSPEPTIRGSSVPATGPPTSSFCPSEQGTPVQVQDEDDPILSQLTMALEPLDDKLTRVSEEPIQTEVSPSTADHAVAEALVPSDAVQTAENPTDSAGEAPTSPEGPQIVPIEDQLKGRSPRRGCEAYEALAPVERLLYCSNVLLPEAIIQVLLWRAGKRRTADLLSAEEEVDLHAEGEKLRRETDFVFDALRVRQLKQDSLKKKGLWKEDQTGAKVEGKTRRKSRNR